MSFGWLIWLMYKKLTIKRQMKKQHTNHSWAKKSVKNLKSFQNVVDSIFTLVDFVSLCCSQPVNLFQCRIATKRYAFIIKIQFFLDYIRDFNNLIYFQHPVLVWSKSYASRFEMENYTITFDRYLFDGQDFVSIKSIKFWFWNLILICLSNVWLAWAR